ncbi:DUF6048 family protein [Salegentibacter sp. F188]|uniref:DUF6048 family protein n=1 Tax=Autumnicola patrickiae TaxID=3075591 RepID=A0ABU3E7A5_9FLAO|nr:DUF6048 family protein [Salegentibacter sp. F188]MDT0691864.1 DUF6048 family protein [Salegentibacter sp. F188]
MKIIPTYLFIINIILLLSFNTGTAQTEAPQDSIQYKEKYGLRVGADLSKLLRTVLQDDYRGFELVGDYRVYDNFYAAAEIGNEQITFDEGLIRATSSGSYAKIGADYNAYENWLDMQNSIFVGIRYGFATFSQELEEYTIYTTTPYFGPDTRTPEDGEATGLTANWVELMAGIKVEVLKNLFLSANVQLKRRIGQNTPTGFDNLSIPGFNRTYDESQFGVGYGYTISYLLPLYKK